MRQINEAGLRLIKEAESCELTAYRCPAGVLTIGFGHTGKDVKGGMSISKARAEELLRHDLSFAEATVGSAAGDATDNQFAAMVSLCFNIGAGNFAKSSVLREHRMKRYDAAADAFMMWTKSKGKVLPGLVRRRGEEAALYRDADHA